MELAGDEVVEEGTEEWLNTVDHGGLWHVNDDACNLFVGFEYVAKKVLIIGKDINNENIKKKLHNSILADEKIKFKWSLLSAEMDEKAATLLFNEMVSLFITVRGLPSPLVMSRFISRHKRKICKKRRQSGRS